MNKNSQIESLQLLRAIAVLLVIYTHTIFLTELTIGRSFQSEFWHLEFWGSIGLDIFFIISGIIMTIVIPAYTKPDGWKDFILKRIIRIIPLYWLLSFVEFFLRSRYEAVSPEAVFKTIFFLPYPVSDVFTFPIILVGWSLSFEMLFYFFIALSLKLSEKNIYKVLLIAIVVLSITGLIVDPTNAVLKFVTSPLLLEFAIGITIGLFYRHPMQERLKYGKGIAVTAIVTGLVLMMVTIYTGFGRLNFAEVVGTDNNLALTRCIIWGIPSGIFIYGIVLLDKTRSLKVPRILIKLGDASYSAYLIHFTVIIYALKVYRPLHLQHTDIFIVLCTLFGFFISIPFYNYIESPITGKVSLLYKDRKQLFTRKAVNV